MGITIDYLPCGSDVRIRELMCEKHLERHPAKLCECSLVLLVSMSFSNFSPRLPFSPNPVVFSSTPSWQKCRENHKHFLYVGQALTPQHTFPSCFISFDPQDTCEVSAGPTVYQRGCAICLRPHSKSGRAGTGTLLCLLASIQLELLSHLPHPFALQRTSTS